MVETAPSDVPPECQYLLELGHSTLCNASSYKDQTYWVLALKASWRAGWQTAAQRGGQGSGKRKRIVATTARRIWYDFSALVGQMRYELCQGTPTRTCPYFTSVLASIASNKRLRILDWGAPLTIDMLKFHPQLVPGEITRWDNHLLPLVAMLYVKHMAFQKTIMSAV